MTTSLWPDLDGTEANPDARYLGQRSSVSNVIV